MQKLTKQDQYKSNVCIYQKPKYTELKDKSSCIIYVPHVSKGYLLSVNKLKSKTKLNQEIYKRKEQFTEIEI